MPAVKARLTSHGQLLYQEYRAATATFPDGMGVAIEKNIPDFISEILCGPVGSFSMDCLHCKELKRLHVGTFCVDCALGAISTT